MNEVTATEPAKKVDKRSKAYKDSARERSAAGLSVDEAHRTGITMGNARDPNTKVEQERVRIPLNSGQNHAWSGYPFDWDNYHYHTFHESPSRQGRIQKAKEAFYEHCTDRNSGENLKCSAGAGFDYLMRLPKKYWQEDMAASRAKRERLRMAEQTLKGDGKLQEYGIDSKSGRPVFEGETPVKRSSTVADNPYA